MMVVVFNLWQLILKGGVMMWPIVLLSVITIAVGVEKILSLTKVERLIKAHQKTLMQSLQQESIKDVLSQAETCKGPLGSLFKAALLKFGSSSEVIKTAMEEVFVYEKKRLHEKMEILSFIMNASVLMGLLGTVIGFTNVFYAIQIRANVLNPLSAGEMASGVWQALFSTVAGLLVCILSFSIYSFCRTRIDNIITDLELTMSQARHVLVQLAELNPD